MQTPIGGWSGRPRSTGFLGGVLFLIGALAVLMILAVVAALSLLLIALFGIVMLAERLLAMLVPAYRRRRRERYITVPTVLIRSARFGSRPTQVIEAKSYEVPDKGTDTRRLSR